MPDEPTFLYVQNNAILTHIPRTKEQGLPVVYNSSPEIRMPGVVCADRRLILSLLKNHAVVCFTPEPLQFNNASALYCGTRHALPFRSYSMHDIVQEGITHICDVLMEASRAFPQTTLLVSLNVLDPAFNSASNNPGGMTTRELLYFIKRLRHLKNITFGVLTDVVPENYPVAGVLLAEML